MGHLGLVVDCCSDADAESLLPPFSYTATVLHQTSGNVAPSFQCYVICPPPDR